MVESKKRGNDMLGVTTGRSEEAEETISVLMRISQMELVRIDPVDLHSQLTENRFLDVLQGNEEENRRMSEIRYAMNRFSHGLKDALGTDENRAKYQIALHQFVKKKCKPLYDFLLQNITARHYIRDNLAMLEPANAVWKEHSFLLGVTHHLVEIVSGTEEKQDYQRQFLCSLVTDPESLKGWMDGIQKQSSWFVPYFNSMRQIYDALSSLSEEKKKDYVDAVRELPEESRPLKIFLKNTPNIANLINRNSESLKEIAGFRFSIREEIPITEPISTVNEVTDSGRATSEKAIEK